MRKILRKTSGTTIGFTFTAEERKAYGLDEVGAVYDIEIYKLENWGKND